MEQINPTKHWGLLLIRSLLYLALGIRSLFTPSPLTSQSVLLISGLLIVAGLCGCAYAFFTLRADRNYFWSLLRSGFDILFGGIILVYADSNPARFQETLALWAVMYTFIQAVQAMYIFMLSGGQQPRNIFGSVLHFLSVLLAGGTAYSLITPNPANTSWVTIGTLITALGILMITLAVQQRQTLLVNKSA